MNFKLLALGIFTATGIVSGSFLISTPAQAATVVDGDTLAFGGFAKFNKTSGYLDFAGGPTGGTFGPSDGIAAILPGSSGSAFGPIFSKVTVKDLKLALVPDTTNSWALSAVLPGFLTVTSNGLQFRLDTFILSNTKGDWLAQYTGQFDGGINGIGEFDPLSDKTFTTNIGSFYSADATAVPTPALLPGLVGIGVAALRKRNQQGGEDETNA